MRTETFCAVGALALLSACASTPTTDPRDPYENYNRKVQSFNDGLDDYVMKPVAEGYKWLMPDFADQGISNFFSNIGEIGVIANDALQGNFSQSGEDGARFLINSTAGLGGFIDVGAMLDLPKHDESFDKTLAVWGMDTGSYLVLPLVGPSSTRGLGGIAGDAAFNPTTYLGASFAVSGLSGAVRAIDKRADNLEKGKIIDEAAIDRYEFFKNAYFSRKSYAVEIGGVQETVPLELNGSSE
ncbi:MlaA family lipoprotein [Methylomonas sp. MS20]|uniref:MlaA family lipoprotein n=1 Tax=unclassified Methylomonas TaxID=2608980 RepID=UPI0028A4961F|nr:VacJ family lipoprotein [Methylomonas sp. MV1]MDT4328820.1 VacJ family lipoprotein [Methylomonas sp. MV1]